MDAWIPSCGLLHSDICGSMLAYSSPQLFAVNHVLLRLPMPRHPLYALLCFTICSLLVLLRIFASYSVVFLPDISSFHLHVFSTFVVSLAFAFFMIFCFQAAFLCSLSRTDINQWFCLIDWYIFSNVLENLILFSKNSIQNLFSLTPFLSIERKASSLKSFLFCLLFSFQYRKK